MIDRAVHFMRRGEQRGFLSPLLIGGIVLALSIGALGLQTWRLGRAQAAVGALEQREAQLQADVEMQALALADERAERARVDTLLAQTATQRARAQAKARQSDARYRDALRLSQDAQDWAATRMPDAAVERLCADEAGSHESGAGAGAASVCAARGLSAAATSGADKRGSVAAGDGAGKRD